MTDRIHPTLTATEFERRYAGRPYELIEGIVFKKVSPNYQYGSIVSRLIHVLYTYLETRGIDEGVVTETDFPFGERSILRPDLAYITPANRKPPMRPDLVVEVISPSERKAGIERKLALYKTAHIPLIWLIFTRRPRAVVYTYDPVVVGYAQPVTIPFAGTLDGGTVLPNFAVPLAALFPATQLSSSFVE